MNCPKCGTRTRVIDSRTWTLSTTKTIVQRQRICDVCGKFETFEQYETQQD